MLASASLAFRQAGPEALAALVQALRQYPQPPYGRPAHASGRTEQALAFEATDEGLTVTGPAHVQALITGRRPTSGGNSGGPKLSEVLAQWAQDKGLPLQRGQTYKTVGYLIARRIHAAGTALFRLGTPSGLLESVLTKEWLTVLTARIAAGEQVAIATALTHAIQGK